MEKKITKFSYSFREPWLRPFSPFLRKKYYFQKMWLHHVQDQMGP